MTYEICGGSLPVVKIQMEAGEIIQCEKGAMSWMDDEIEMSTEGTGGIGKMFGRMVTGESAFLNKYVAKRPGEFAMASSFPGSIVAYELTPDCDIIVQKGSFLGMVGNIDSEIYLQHGRGTGLFGGEGFLMRRYHGTGVIFLEIDGSAHSYEIPAGDKKIVDTGYVAAIYGAQGQNAIEIRRIKGVKNVLFGGEGLFNTVVNGPCTVTLQSMPIVAAAMRIYEYLPKSSS